MKILSFLLFVSVLACSIFLFIDRVTTGTFFSCGILWLVLIKLYASLLFFRVPALFKFLKYPPYMGETWDLSPISWTLSKEKLKVIKIWKYQEFKY